ncbi:MAG TPA: penicillin-binding transpeptidase domain-containing protein, partial [Acidimicrobiales bacterium]|nr:penicillin-binding transpeptidase domain-containing protein [Acidimicrobiales bacterium]
KLFTLIGALERYNVEDSIAAASPCAVVFPGVPYADGYNLSHMLHNDPGQPNGPVTLVRATADSINCAYLRLAHEVGLADIVAIAKSLGVTDATLNPENPSLVIGTESVRPIEMTAAYATVADGGIYHTPDFVKEIEGLSGAVIYRADMVGRRIFSDEVANEAIIALRATVQWGTGTAAAIAGQDVAGKTGTTSNSVDAWFNGISPTLACSVWIGNPSGEVPMYAGGAEVYGASFPTKIWHDIAAYVLRGAAQASFPPPDPAMVPPVKYIDSPGLARDDLLSHGGVIPSATTTTLRTTTTLPTVLATTPLPAVTVTPTVSLTPGDLVTPAVTVTAAKIAPSPSTSTSFPSAAAVPSAASSTDGVNGRP